MQPVIRDVAPRLCVADGVPDTSKPMSNEHKHEDEQNEYCRPVFYIMIQLPGHPAQSEQAHHLQRAEQARYTL